jgi:hypothetical protein
MYQQLFVAEPIQAFFLLIAKHVLRLFSGVPKEHFKVPRGIFDVF